MNLANLRNLSAILTFGIVSLSPFCFAEIAPNQSTSAEDGASQSADKILQDLASSLERTVDIDLDDIRVPIKKLQEQKEEGSRAIQNFLRSNQDVIFRPCESFQGNRLKAAPTLRTALLAALYDLNDAVSEATNVEVLKTTTSSLEVLLSVQNLEKVSPGKYRSEALKAALATAKCSHARDSYSKDIASYYQASEIVPELEKIENRSEKEFDQLRWIDFLSNFPTEVQLASLKRIYPTGVIAEDGWIKADTFDAAYKPLVTIGANLVKLDLNINELRQIVSQTFLKKMNVKQKSQFLSAFRFSTLSDGNYFLTPSILKSNENQNHSKKGVGKDPILKAKVEGALIFLNEVEPQLDSALKKELTVAREDLQKSLKPIEASPPPSKEMVAKMVEHVMKENHCQDEQTRQAVTDLFNEGLRNQAQFETGEISQKEFNEAAKNLEERLNNLFQSASKKKSAK
jgi:hypothetical protein